MFKNIKQMKMPGEPLSLRSRLLLSTKIFKKRQNIAKILELTEGIFDFLTSDYSAFNNVNQIDIHANSEKLFVILFAKI